MTQPIRVRLLVASAVVVFLVESVLLYGYTMDDAFISFRYARNLARGDGLVYNPGEPPVEGYSNFLWTLLFAPVIGVGWDPEPVAKVLGILCGLGILAVTARLGRRLSPGSSFQAVAVILAGSSPVMAMQAITGLETHLFALFFLCGIWMTAREWEDRRRFPLSALAFLGCALTRPEGALLFVVSLAAAMALRGGDRVSRRSPAGWLALSIIVFGAGYGLYTVWRLTYFGALIPNTFYAKTAGLRQLGKGWEYLRDFSNAHGGVLIYLVAFLGLALRWKDALVRYLALIGTVFLAMVVYEGGDWMPLFRLMAPVLPVLGLLFQVGLEALYRGFRGPVETPGGRGAAGVITAGTAGALLAFSLAPLPAKAREAMERPGLYAEAHRRYARWLAANTPPGEAIALSDIGQFGYYSDLPVIDLVGLTNPEIARSAGLLHEKKVDARGILKRRPAHVVVVCYRDGQEWKGRGFPVENALLASPDFQDRYELARLVYYKEDYAYWIFSRKDLRGSDGRPGARS